MTATAALTTSASTAHPRSNALRRRRASATITTGIVGGLFGIAPFTGTAVAAPVDAHDDARPAVWEADLVTEITGPAKTRPGRIVTYVFTVTNDGPEASEPDLDVLISTAGLRDVTTEPAAGTVREDEWYWTLPSIEPGQTTAFSITGTVDVRTRFRTSGWDGDLRRPGLGQQHRLDAHQGPALTPSRQLRPRLDSSAHSARPRRCCTQ